MTYYTKDGRETTLSSANDYVYTASGVAVETFGGREARKERERQAAAAVENHRVATGLAARLTVFLMVKIPFGAGAWVAQRVGSRTRIALARRGVPRWIRGPIAFVIALATFVVVSAAVWAGVLIVLKGGV